MNSNLRTSMDLMVRDLLQVGQGLPIGRRSRHPERRRCDAHRPSRVPAAPGACDGVTHLPRRPFAAGGLRRSGLGPAIDGHCTDVITTLALDGSAEGLNVSSIAADGRSITIHGDQTSPTIRTRTATTSGPAT